MLPLIWAGMVATTAAMAYGDQIAEWWNGPQPPQPATPVVPGGGYSGAVTDPGAVDEVIRRTDAETKRRNQDFFDERSRELESSWLAWFAGKASPPTDDGDGGNGSLSWTTWLVVGLVAGGVGVALLKGDD